MSGEYYIVRGLLTCVVLLTTYHSGEQIEHNDMGGHVAEMGGEEVYRFWWGNLREELEEIGVYGRIILRWIFRKWDAGHGWIDLVEDRARWRSIVNAGSIKCGECLY